MSCSSGWPSSTICSSFFSAVSRLVSSRNCSSTSAERFWASSIISTLCRPAAWALSRSWLMASTRILIVALAAWAIPSSSQMADNSSRAERRGFRISAVDVFRGILDKAPAYGGLSGTNFAGDHDKAALPLHAIHQVRQGFLVAITQVQVAGVWRYGKRRFPKAKKIVVHVSSGPGRSGTADQLQFYRPPVLLLQAADTTFEGLGNPGVGPDH